jgi:hypothetical protein
MPDEEDTAKDSTTPDGHLAEHLAKVSRQVAKEMANLGLGGKEGAVDKVRFV